MTCNHRSSVKCGPQVSQGPPLPTVRGHGAGRLEQLPDRFASSNNWRLYSFASPPSLSFREGAIPAVKGEIMKKVVVLLALLAFVFTGSVIMATAAENMVCCKDGQRITANASTCVKYGGKVVPKSQCGAPAKKK